MDPFGEWAKSSTQHASVQKYADCLIEIGASWDSFLSSRDPEAIAANLIEGGIPALAARDIVEVASAAAKKSQAPMAIFWDIENMPIPATSSGRDVSSRLKAILKPYGDLEQFRGYASIGLNLIPQQKRSDLQLSGCLLVDCPHNGRKEVADKMIIVDAMNFAMKNPNGATFCFVTGDTDYAYLLAVLQRYTQYRTIVISKGTMQSMLDVNCDMKMRWETDILQLRSAKAWKNTTEDLDLASTDDTSVSPSEENKESQESFEPLTADEEWIDDTEFLRNLVRKECASLGFALKSNIGNGLRQTNPARFPHREAVQTFLAKVIENGVVSETGEGGLKVLNIPADETTGMFPAIALSGQVPMPLESIPDRVRSAAASRPYVIFIKWKFCPSGTTLPSNAFVQHKDAWGILLFQTLTDAQRTASEFSWLRNGTLVDWRKVKHDGPLPLSAYSNYTAIQRPPNGMACSLCRAIRENVELQQLDGPRSGFACPECKSWKDVSPEEKETAANKVVELLGLMALNDDISVPEKILRNLLSLKKELGCESRKLGSLWIKHAIELRLVVHHNMLGQLKSKTAKVCLSSRLRDTTQPYPPDDLDTTKEEDYIVQFLWKGIGWSNRIGVNQRLKETYPRMAHPYYRSKVFLNAHKKELLYLSKSPYAQVVGLTQKGADEGLATFDPPVALLLGDSEPQLIDDSTHESGSED